MSLAANFASCFSLLVWMEGFTGKDFVRAVDDAFNKEYAAVIGQHTSIFLEVLHFSAEFREKLSKYGPVVEEMLELHFVHFMNEDSLAELAYLEKTGMMSMEEAKESPTRALMSLLNGGLKFNDLIEYYSINFQGHSEAQFKDVLKRVSSKVKSIIGEVREDSLESDLKDACELVEDQ